MQTTSPATSGGFGRNGMQWSETDASVSTTTMELSSTHFHRRKRPSQPAKLRTARDGVTMVVATATTTTTTTKTTTETTTTTTTTSSTSTSASTNNHMTTTHGQPNLYQSARMIEAQSHFRKVVKQELQVLLVQGMEREVAVRKLLKRIVQSTLEPDPKDVERVMKQFQMNQEDAVRALIVKQEIGRLKRKGLDAFAAIEMLTRKMQRITTESDDDELVDEESCATGAVVTGFPAAAAGDRGSLEQSEMVEMQSNDANVPGTESMSESDSNDGEDESSAMVHADAEAEVDAIVDTEAVVDVDVVADATESTMENDCEQVHDEEEEQDAATGEEEEEEDVEEDEEGEEEEEEESTKAKQMRDLEAEKKLYLSSLSLCCQRIDNVSISPLPHVTPLGSSSSTESSPMISFRQMTTTSSPSASLSSKRKRRSAGLGTSFMQESSVPTPDGSAPIPFALGPSNKKQKLCQKMEDALVNMITRRAASSVKSHHGTSKNHHPKGHRSGGHASSSGGGGTDGKVDGAGASSINEISLSHAVKSRKRQRGVTTVSSPSSSPPPLLLPPDAEEFTSEVHVVKRPRK